MKTIAFTLQKGGTGKTTLAIAIAAELSKTKKTILIDADAQGTASSWLLTQSSSDKEFADVLFGEAKVNQVITSIDTLDVLPTFAIGGRLQAFIDNQAQSKPLAMKKILKELSNYYDFAIIDFAPGFSLFERNAIVCCDEAIAPVIPDEAGIDGIEIFIKNIRTAQEDLETEKPTFKKIIINAMDERIAQFAKNAQALKKDLKEIKFYTIPTDQVFRKIQAKHELKLIGARKDTIDEIQRIVKDILGDK